MTAKGLGAWAWTRAQWRARWRSLVALGVLLGAVGGLSAAALAGARRTSTSLPRLRQRTRAADAIVFPGQVGVYKADWGALERRPEVVELARWTLTFGRATGEEDEAVFFVPSDRHWLTSVDRPLVVAGRMFRPDAPDEVVVGEAAAGHRSSPEGASSPPLRVGSIIHYKPFTVGQDDTGGEPPNGPDLELRVVGVVRHVHELLFVPGMVMPSPAFLDRYGRGILLVENAMVRLAHGAADVPVLRHDVNDLVAPGTPVDDLHVLQRRVDTTLGVERTALLLLAAAIAVGGFLVAAPALGRSVHIGGDDVRVLRAMGFDRSAIASCTVASHLLVAVLAAGSSLAIAVIASRWFPVGLASKIDPDRGVHADWAVLGPEMAVAAAIVLGSAAAVGWRLSSARRLAGDPSTFPVLSPLTRLAPVTVALGATMALRRGADRSIELVRPALVGTAVGVLGVVATLTINRGLDDALVHPARAGVTWQATVTPSPADRTPTGVNSARVDSIGALPQVAGTAVVSRLVSDVKGAGVPVFSVRRPAGGVSLRSTTGRRPTADGEAAIGPRTARELHVRRGDTVTVGSLHRRVRIVGEALFPTDVHAGFDEGLWVTPAVFDSMEPPGVFGDPNTVQRVIAIRFRRGVRPAAGIDAVKKAEQGAIAAVAPVDVPPELANLRNVRTLPLLLASLLAVFAASAVALVMSTTVQRRRRDFATLRALGLTAGSARTIVNMQGTAMVGAGLLVGVPLGMASGRLAWRLVAERVPLAFVAPLALVTTLVVVVAALVVVNVLALWPGWRATRLRPAEVLRAE